MTFPISQILDAYLSSPLKPLRNNCPYKVHIRLRREIFVEKIIPSTHNKKLFIRSAPRLVTISIAWEGHGVSMQVYIRYISSISLVLNHGVWRTRGKKRKFVNVKTKLSIFKHLDEGYNIQATATKFNLLKVTVQAAKQNIELLFKKGKSNLWEWMASTKSLSKH